MTQTERQELRRWKRLVIPSRELVPLLTGRARLTNLPPDTEFLHATHDPFCDGVVVYVRSSAFPEVGEACEIPLFLAEVRSDG